MKEELRKVFLDLSNKRLSESEALERIKAIKLANSKSDNKILYAYPRWVLDDNNISLNGLLEDYKEHQILFIQSSPIDLVAIEQLVSGSRCFQIPIEKDNKVDGFNEVASKCFEHLQNILNSKPKGKVLVQIAIGDIKNAEIYTGLSGLLKTAFLENPNLYGQIVWSDQSKSLEEFANQLIREKEQSTETIIKYENDERYVLIPQEVKSEQHRPLNVFREKGIYLITGGLGGLGILFAKEILKQTPSARVILTGRSKLSNKKEIILNKISRKGGYVRYMQLDVTDRNAVNNCVFKIINDYKALHGIIHAAGVNSDNFILKKNVKEFKKVIAPKVAGTYNLDEASKRIDLDFMVFFSSVASWLGNIGQSDYSTANGYMDQYAMYRDQLVKEGKRHGKTLSVNWPLWKEGGMSIPDEIKEQLEEETGITLLESSTGMHLFYESLNLAYSRIIAVQGNPNKIRPTLFSDQRAPQIAAITQYSNKLDTDAKSLLDKTRIFLREEFSKVLKLPLQRIETKVSLEKYGIDSILAMKLTSQLEKTFGKLSKTLFFEYQSIDEFCEYFIGSHKNKLLEIFDDTPQNENGTSDKIQEQIKKPESTSENRIRVKRKVRHQKSESLNAVSKTQKPYNEPIAIIGISGRYPEAENLNEFWKNLRDGKDCIIEVPKDRWDWKEYYSEDRTVPNKHYSKWGGFIAGVDEFDPRFFNISPREARNIDPQERLFLQHAWMAVEDAGYSKEGLQIPSENDQAGQIGVYAGVMYGEYNISGSLASIANRVSYFLNLHGPSITLDTMCSSSLTAIHLACEDLKSGRTSMALAGGVNVSIDPNKYQMLSSGQFISSDGHCQSFGEGGDGYIPGEGVGIAVLKRLSEAEADGDHIYGVIKGSALNHGGKTNGYSVPNPKAQANAISRALRESNTNPRHISYIEAHGTGTKLGDPIELASLNKAFSETDDKHFCLLGSAKSNIGHCESAAGIAGLTKILLQLKHRKIVPSLHSERLNPHIDFDNTPFVVNQTLRDWKNPIIEGKKLPLIAGISSFGAGGANAHVIVSEYEGVLDTRVSMNRVAILLSARTSEQLQQKAEDLLDFVIEQESSGISIDLPSMGYTLQVGREAMEERLGLVVTSMSDLQNKLREYLSAPSQAAGVFRDQVKRHKESVLAFSSSASELARVDSWLQTQDYAALIGWWVKGLDIDWSALYGSEKPLRMSLPTYPFARERYWLAADQRGRNVSTSTGRSVLHPLVHSNTSDLTQIGYSTHLSGTEALIKDYRFGKNGSAVPGLPLISSLEMARVSLERSLPLKDADKHVLTLHDIRFGCFIELDRARTIGIALFAQGSGAASYEVYSEQDGQEKIYSQGEALYQELPTPSRLDIDALKGQMTGGGIDANKFYEQLSKGAVQYGSSYRGVQALYRGSGGLLAQLSLPQEVTHEQEEYQLHPVLLESVLQAATGLLVDLEAFPDAAVLPESIAEVQLHSRCTTEMYGWIRPSKHQGASSRYALDIDLCDGQGQVCVALKGVTYQQGESAVPVSANHVARTIEKPLKVAAVTTEQVPRELLFTPRLLGTSPATTTTATITGTLQKPTDVSLATPEPLAQELLETGAIGKAQVYLTSHSDASLPQAPAVTASAQVRLYSEGNGIYSLRLTGETLPELSSTVLMSQLLGSLDAAREATDGKVLVIYGTASHFLQGGVQAHHQGIDHGLYQALIRFPYPVIAAMQGDAHGAGLLVGTMCDFMICAEESKYGYSRPEEDLYADPSVRALLDERFGSVLTRDLLQNSVKAVHGYSGVELKAKGFTFPVVARGSVETYAATLAKNLSKKSATALRLLKQHLSRHLAEKVASLKVVTPTSKKTVAKITTEGLPKASSFTLKTTDHTLIIEISKLKGGKAMAKLLKELSSLFTALDKMAAHMVLIITSETSGFLPESMTVEDTLAFTGLLQDCKHSLIGVLDTGAAGKGWLVSQYLDAVIYTEQGSYHAAGLIGESNELSRIATAVFAQHLGRYISKEVLLLHKSYTGSELQARHGGLTVVKGSEAMQSALDLAATWQEQPVEVLQANKVATMAQFKAKLGSLPEWNQGSGEPQTEKDRRKLGVIELQSEVVKATLHAGGIVEVRLEDREARNMFTDAFIAGVSEVFAHIAGEAHYKVVVLTGYDNYFASGGTREGLLSIQEGKSKFTDTKIYQLAMECKLPVIAAMQGHGIGAGWCLGMFADFILFSKERKYVSPYMTYGFTPGAGATFIFPERMGYDLARETMLTGDEYSGVTFAERGTHLPVLGKDEVVTTAMEIAQQLAIYSREDLMAIKHQYTYHLLQKAAETYPLELAMHEKTFVKDAQTLAQIEKSFTAKNHTSTEEIVPIKDTDTNTEEDTISGELTLSEIIATIRVFLAEELQIEEHEIDEDSPFVDLGLDSITGVTWIRKINNEYKTSIEATQVYNYPTLGQLGAHVKEEMEKLGLLSGSTTPKTPTSTNIQYEQMNTEDSEEAPSGEQMLSEIIATIRAFLAEELQIEEHEIDEESPFVDLGLDSITGVTWIRKINNEYKTSIEATQVYNYPTLGQLGVHVKEEMEKLGLLSEASVPKKQVTGKPKSVPKIESGHQLTSEFGFKEISLSSLRNKKLSQTAKQKSSPYKAQPIAVIGMAGQFPEADNTEAFWNNIAQGKNCIKEVPKERWDIDTYYQAGNPAPGKTNSKWLGSLEGYDKFDPLFFTISPVEAESMDPQQRLFLQSCWHGIEDAGYNPHALSGTKCGVFVGCTSGDYQLLSREQQISAQGFTGGTSSILAARISYFLNLQGPCIAIDTACSSSLVAISNACDSLLSGSSDIALAGGVYVMTGPEMHIKTAQSGMLSQDGKCHTFDQQANGFVPGEAVGVVMLKRLEDAEKDNDRIYGVIEGWGINQDGRTNGITAPNSMSQTSLEQDVYDRYEINPEQIQLIEAHGTGTKLGDPIEVSALKESFKKYTSKNEYCALGSVKSNIGHCLTAAGIAGFIKVLMAMKYKKLPPTINYDQLNEHISLKESPFYVNDKLQDWKVDNGSIRRAAISGFGFSGTNSHVVIAEYPTGNKIKPSISVITQNQNYLIPLSARNGDQLKETATNLLKYLETETTSIDLIELSYTLQVGRAPMEERLGILVSSVKELADKLRAYIGGEDRIKDLYEGQVKNNKEGLKLISQDREMKEIIIKKWISDRKLTKLIDLWVKGLDFEWDLLYGETKPQRMRLPLYPFARERYWIESTEPIYQPETFGQTTPKLHPLLHQNEESLKEKGFKSTLETANGFENEEGLKKPKIRRIKLPTYPFSNERCWPELTPEFEEREEESMPLLKNFDSIEDVIGRIDSELIDEDEAVILLKDLI
ncbi:SDR family NAD(P)-dependent oxidoreductase [Flavobacteriaceae bacterium M23B6Z8]